VVDLAHQSSRDRACVLVVDDEETNRKLLNRLLSGEYTVVPAQDGEEALALVERIDVDLILLDVRLPGLD
jgi:CheY-like chemotaxis protein